MKKLIVLSVIFALVAGSVFSADVSVEVIGTAALLKGSSEEKLDYVKDDGTPVYTTKDHNKTDYGVSRARISASGATEDGTIGASLRYDAAGNGGAVGTAYGWAWWKPSELFRLQIGSNGGDGEFGLEGVTGWSFYQLAGDVLGNAGNAWGGGNESGAAGVVFRDAFFGGWNAPGIMITSKPIEALTINLAFPINGGVAYKEYQKFTLQAAYNIDGVGTAGITYKNGLGHEDGKYSVGDVVTIPGKSGKGYTPGAAVSWDKDGEPNGWATGTWATPPVPDTKHKAKLYGGETNDPSNLFIYFGLSAIENLGVDVGVGLTLPSDVTHTEEWDIATDKKVSEETVTKNYPVAAGVGANFSAGALGVKARVVGKFGGNTETKETAGIGTSAEKTTTIKLADDWGMIINVQPSYAINETLTAYLSLGIGFSTGNEYIDKAETVKKGETVIAVDNSSDVAWHVQPYIVITPNYWSGAFFAGFRLESPVGKYETKNKEGDVTNNRIVDWSIPIGIRISF